MMHEITDKIDEREESAVLLIHQALEIEKRAVPATELLAVAIGIILRETNCRDKVEYFSDLIRAAAKRSTTKKYLT